VVERETRGLREPETEVRGEREGEEELLWDLERPGLRLTVALAVVLRDTVAEPLTRALLLLLWLMLGEVVGVLLCRGERDRESVAVWLLLCVLELVATWQRVGLGVTRGVAEVEGQLLELRVPL
jgi:hypothetical protein